MQQQRRRIRWDRWPLPLRGRWLRYFLAPLIGLCVLMSPCVLLFTWDIPFHNWRLWQFSRTAAHLSHLPGSSRLRAVSKVDSFQCQGNTCVYFVGELRTCTGTEADVLRYYRGRTVPAPDGSPEPCPVEIRFPKDGEWTTEDPTATPVEEAVGTRAPVLPRGVKCYLVYVVWGEYGGFDVRCS